MQNVTKGFKTTEFWVALSAILFLIVEGVLYYFKGLEPNTPVTLGVVGSAIGYGTQRAYVKGKSNIFALAASAVPAVAGMVESFNHPQVVPTNPDESSSEVKVESSTMTKEVIFSDSQTEEPIPVSFAPVEKVVN